MTIVRCCLNAIELSIKKLRNCHLVEVFYLEVIGEFYLEPEFLSEVT
jgi:hypothetical protein